MTCEYCNRPLPLLASGKVRLNKRHCDRLCKERAKRRVELAAEPPKPRHCLYCGEMLQPPGERLYRTRMYCNWKCQQAAWRAGKGKRGDDMAPEQIERLFQLAQARQRRARQLAG